MSIKILFTGGGTGGHIYPILAVAEELQAFAAKRNISVDLRYLGAPGKFKKLLVSNGVGVSKILSAKLRRYFDVRNFIDFVLFPFSVIQALWKVFWIMPDVVFSKGGPGSLPVVVACWFYRVPVIIHDSDSTFGLANKLAVIFADRIAVSFSSAIEEVVKTQKNATKTEYLRSKISLVGNPIRPSLFTGDVLDKQTAKKIWGFDSSKPLVLVLGGSQGSSTINDFMLNIAGELIKDFQFLHQTGVDNFGGVGSELAVVLKGFGEEEKSRYKIVPYFEKNIRDAYGAADLVISRASAGSIFEIAAFGKPSILIPLREEVVGNHQIMNAYEYAREGAAVVIEEENLKPHIFMAQLNKIINNSDSLNKMSKAALAFSKPDAALKIAEEIIRLSNN
jgi:UDP-N-acetylglucosamine--N-acetylmuramyl-(pentapeptide) pyrophosphoryl-undecaprenol N-acetylglucosamine transferase